MLDCLIIGDSIAQGMRLVEPQCAYYATPGLTTIGWLKKYAPLPLNAKYTLISLGTNDYEKANTYEHLKKVRSGIKGEHVYWIAPNAKSKPRAHALVQQVSQEFGDTIIGTTRWQADKIHPSWAGYKQIAQAFRK